MNTKNNRKSRMTKRIFHETLLSLLQTHHIAEISVKGLCEAADLNRSTFYAYYQNQMDILREIEEMTYKDVEKLLLSGINSDGSADSTKIFETLLQYILENSKLFRILMGQNGSQDFQEKLMELTEAANQYRKVDPASASGDNSHYVRCYRVAGCTRVIEEWIRSGFNRSVQDIAKLLIHLSEG